MKTPFRYSSPGFDQRLKKPLCMRYHQRLAFLVCQPSNKACKVDGTGFKTTSAGSRCTIGDPGYSAVSAEEECKFTCVNGALKQSSDCRDRVTEPCPSGETWSYSQEKCVDVDRANPTQIACEKGGGQWVEKLTRTCTGWCVIGFGSPTETVEPYCRKENLFLQVLPWILLGVLFLIVIILLVRSGGGKGGGRKP